MNQIKLTRQEKQSKLPKLYVLTAFTILLVAAMNVPLLSKSAPLGIISLSFAPTPDAARKMIASWSVSAIQWARIGLICDFVSLVLYVMTLANLAAIIGRKLAPMWVWLPRANGIIVTTLAVIAAAFDVVENLGILMELSGHFTQLTAHAIWWSAAVKFGILSIVCGWCCLAALVAWFTSCNPYLP